MVALLRMTTLSSAKMDDRTANVCGVMTLSVMSMNRTTLPSGRRPSRATTSESLLLAPEQRLFRVLRGQGDDGI